MLKRRFAIGGTAFCLISALGYTASNICMRRLTVLHCDPFWAVCGRELATTLVILPWLLSDCRRGRSAMPKGAALWQILAVGVLVQLVGNIGSQWSLDVVGLAVTIPASYGAMIAGGALLGRVWLGEPISRRSASAVAVLMTSLILLGVGTGATRSLAVADGDALRSALAVLMAVVAGATYALLSAAIRRCVTRGVSPLAVGVLVPWTGVVALGPICGFRAAGTVHAAAAPVYLAAASWTWMLAAGCFNAVGFLGIIYGLQRTTVVHANTLNASQVAMASLAGILLFHESPNPWILAGIVLTILGIAWIHRPGSGVEEFPPP